MTTRRQLQQAAAAYKAALGRTRDIEHERDQLIRQALTEGWKVRDLTGATGLSIGRISQIRTGSR